jgi:hypothetical protein
LIPSSGEHQSEQHTRTCARGPEQIGIASDGKEPVGCESDHDHHRGQQARKGLSSKGLARQLENGYGNQPQSHPIQNGNH